MRTIFVPCYSKDVTKILNELDGFNTPITIFHDHKATRGDMNIIFICIPLNTNYRRELARTFRFDHRIGDSTQTPKELYP